MPVPKRDSVAGGGNAGNRSQNGSRSDFRTDAAISNKRFGGERTLQRWVPDADDTFDGSLESSSNTGQWDQFAENEKRFGVKSNYDERFYTTAIDKSHPQYQARAAAADKKAREIERSAPVTAHVAEERVMDYVTNKNGEDENEEDKYSGVRRQDVPSLSTGRENRYTPPAKRAPSSQSNVKGAPVDPAIISSQIRAPPKKNSVPTLEQPRLSAPSSHKNGTVTADNESSKSPETLAVDDKTTERAASIPNSTATALNIAAADPTAQTAVPATSSQSTGNDSQTHSENVPAGAPSATATVEKDVLKEFKNFASQQRVNAERVRSTKAKADKEVKLGELKKFADSFKLSTPVPSDLVSIIAKDPAKQKEIQLKAIKNAEEVAKSKADTTSKEQTSSLATPSRATEHQASGATTDPRGSRAAAGPHQSTPGQTGRHNGQRQQYSQSQYHGQAYRNNRNGPQHLPPQQQTGTLAQRLRNSEQQKFSNPSGGPQQAGPHDMRAPPTGPSNNHDSSANRRLSAVPGHTGAKLNPNSHEFKPSPFAASFSPNGAISTSSSPRSAANNVAESTGTSTGGSQLIRRKTKAVDPNKCNILAHIKSIKPTTGRNWDDNGGLRPSYDTQPTWRQAQDDEPKESTMNLTYKQFFERQPFSGSSVPTPNPPHVVPHLAHQHQLPFHLQHGAPGMGPRQSPHLPHMRMDNPQHGHGPHPPYGNDEHRMMQSHSTSSFASPRPGHVPVAYPGAPAGQMPYNQPMYMGPGGPHMGQYRSFSNNPQYGPGQQGQMGGGPMMMQPHFMSGPQGMMAPQMMYPGHPQFMPPSGPQQPMAGMNGYPSPGRPAAPMMTHQGSQQGHPMYGMSPNVQYSQPAYGPGQQGGSMPNARGQHHGGPQQFGTSPQQGNQYGQQQQKGGSGHSHHKNPQTGSSQAPQGPHQTPSTTSATAQARPNEGSTDEAK